ncbi:desmoplakin [Clostera anastomosis granulovirus B]|uniref:Desmoplakin n=1 Tax=Clostera anastomosis granulovirus B TaxID=1986290 RepID=A0A0K0WSB4_9BBAC|nr:desmoplakin [Clostera anastomosis granulovirus B]AKS25441.1 desmoplakin [Clostera anastomosis granulovirus B]
MASFSPASTAAFLFNRPSDDMILTRYKGVDVTPHTFNNLIKTITNQKSISNNSTSKTEFEDRIREIILAFNPNLKKNGAYMTTEYMLVNSLKGTDKKEVTHTYNYNNWGVNGGGGTNGFAPANDDVPMESVDDNGDEDYFIDVVEANTKLKSIAAGEWNDDKMEQLLDVVYSVNEPCVRKINKKYRKYVDNLKAVGRKHKRRGSCYDENNVDTLVSIKEGLNVKKIDNNQVIALCDTMRTFFTNKNLGCDTMEKYVYGFRVLGEKVSRLEQELETSKKLFVEEKSKLAEATRQQVVEEMQTNTVALENKLEAQTKKIKTLTDKCEHLDNTITQNVLEIAKLGAGVGEKDVYIEELQIEVQQCHKQLVDKNHEIQQYEETTRELKCSLEAVRAENTNLDQHNDELLKLNSRLESQVQQLQEQLKQKDDDLNVCNQSFYKILNKKEEDDEDKERGYNSTIQSLTNERNILLQEKHSLQQSVEQYKEFQVNVQIRMQQLESECAIKSRELNQKEQALNLCVNKVEDQNGNYLKKLEEITGLTCKLQNLQKECDRAVEDYDTLKLTLDNVNSKLSSVTQENSDLLMQIEKYYDEGDVAIKENVELKGKIKKLQNDIERLNSCVADVEANCDNKLKHEQDKFEEFKEDLIKQTKEKWQQEKQILIDNYEKKIEVLKCKNIISDHLTSGGETSNIDGEASGDNNSSSGETSVENNKTTTVLMLSVMQLENEAGQI